MVNGSALTCRPPKPVRPRINRGFGKNGSLDTVVAELANGLLYALRDPKADGNNLLILEVFMARHVGSGNAKFNNSFNLIIVSLRSVGCRKVQKRSRGKIAG